MKKFLTIRDVTFNECPWLSPKQNLSTKEVAIPKGTLVYEWLGHDYGVIGEGIGVSLKARLHPFFEVPIDSLKEMEENSA